MKYLPLYEFLRQVSYRDKHIIELIFDYNGIIYGGYLRDIIAGEEPTDIDVAIYKKYFDEFVYKLERKGYKLIEHIKSHNIYTYSKMFSKNIQIHTLNDHDDQYIDIYTRADCNVNNLSYDGEKLYNRTSIYIM